jgi:hypothetical protein
MMTTQALLKRGGAVLGSIGAAALLYQLLLRRSILNWGATEAGTPSSSAVRAHAVQRVKTCKTACLSEVVD